MVDAFYTLTTKLAEESNLSCACQAGDRVAALNIDDFSVHLMLDESTQNAVMQAVVGIIPNHNKEVFFAKLLEWNHGLMQSKGFSYAFFEEEDAVTLQGLISLRDLDMDYAQKVFGHFLEELVNALVALEQFTDELALQA